MRAIKFRAWDAKGYWLDADEFAVQGDGSIILAFSSGPDGSRYRNTDAVVMQFTGLTDKNGRDVYEGDRLGGIYEYSHIEWCDDCGGWSLNLDGAGCAGCGGEVDWREVVSNPEEIEVIGNIYEHSHLMQEDGSE